MHGPPEDLLDWGRLQVPVVFPPKRDSGGRPNEDLGGTLPSPAKAGGSGRGIIDPGANAQSFVARGLRVKPERTIRPPDADLEEPPLSRFAAFVCSRRSRRLRGRPLRIPQDDYAASEPGPLRDVASQTTSLRVWNIDLGEQLE
jgi:hypothetical protein